jgi:5'-3' exonuclease
MGIIDFFTSLNKNKYINKGSIIIDFKNIISCDYLYIDFNSIIYISINTIERELNYILYSVIIKNYSEEAILLSKKWSYELENSTIELYKNYFTNELIHNFILNKIKQYILEIINLCDKDNLKLIYFSIDGVPQMAKEVEQKKRRFNSYVISCLKKKIYEKYNNTLSENRQIYEKNKISFDGNKIISWTLLMNLIKKFIVSENINHDIKSCCKNLINIIVDDHNTYGEGEKKIVEHILKNNLQGKYTIYSKNSIPDLLK